MFLMLIPQEKKNFYKKKKVIFPNQYESLWICIDMKIGFSLFQLGYSSFKICFLHILFLIIKYTQMKC